MNTQKRSRRFYLILAVAITLAVTVSLVVYKWYDIPLTNSLFSGPGPVDIEVTTDKLSYLQGEKVNFTIYVTNPQDWPVRMPLQISYQVDRDGQSVDGVTLNVNPAPGSISTFPAHSARLFDTFVWDQKTGPGSNRTQVQPGNYTFTVSFSEPVSYGEGGNCTIEIRPAP